MLRRRNDRFWRVWKQKLSKNSCRRIERLNAKSNVSSIEKTMREIRVKVPSLEWRESLNSRLPSYRSHFRPFFSLPYSFVRALFARQTLEESWQRGNAFHDFPRLV